MTEFEQALYAVLTSLPKGKVCSYGQVAQRAGYPNYARQVGKTLSKLPKDTTLPWYRVVNSQAKISLQGEAFLRQKRHLEADGLTVNEQGKITSSHNYWA
jgi:methylated-DNA-protein-cysteine methyltransferase-like protein